MKERILIEASAGTGKTQSLAKHLIGLLRMGVKPQEIVALTFSRAAAGEIFERFVSMLAEEARKDPAAGRLLRDTIATQHLSQIGTIDGFLMKIVRSFPLELGLGGELEIMDDYRVEVERGKAAFAILRRTDAASRHAFVDAFTLAMQSENVRMFAEAYRDFIKNWHEIYLSHENPSAWGDPSAIWPDGMPCPLATERELEEAARAVEDVAAADEKLREFAEWTRAFRGTFGRTSVKGLAGKFLELGHTVFEGTDIEIDFSRKHRVYSGAAAKAIRGALLAVCGFVLRRRLELARGIRGLISAYEEVYARQVRNGGELTFADIPRLIAGLDESCRLALEYRMDSRIRSWALDEFQDTSRPQWRAIGPLVEEAKQSDSGKSVFIVGDVKQAIYGWREGDVSIFAGEKASGEYETQDLTYTWRSGPAVVEAVNRVFVDGPLKDEFPTWHSPLHSTAKEELGGFVNWMEAGGTKKEDFTEPVLNAIKAVDPVRRGLSAAILVRTNGFGEMLATQLKLRGVDGVVWEGESAIWDSPALGGFVDLTALADHPGDKQAYNHFVTTPLAKAMYPQGVPDVAELSFSTARAFAEQGLVRCFRGLRAKFPDDPREAWSAFTEERFTDMLRAAAEFELTLRPGTRLSDFAAFLKAKKKRNLAEPGKIKIMTIHRSKGLGFDWVVLPLYEYQAINREPAGPLLADGWVLPDPGAKVSRMTDGLAEAAALRKDRVEQEALCSWYVAMTRAKRAMTIVVQPAPKNPGEARRFSDFVRMSLPQELGDRNWHLKCVPPTEEKKGAETRPPQPERRPRERIARRLPSTNFRSGMSAGELFAVRSVRRVAIESGIEIHDRLERIEWVDPAAPRDALEKAILADLSWSAAFAKPASPAVLWREKGFEQMLDGTWVSGRFDRVVFEGSGVERRATVYDFKTNARRRGESDEALRRRLEEEYGGQMRTYRRVLSVLADLPQDHVDAVVLPMAVLRV